MYIISCAGIPWAGSFTYWNLRQGNLRVFSLDSPHFVSSYLVLFIPLYIPWDLLGYMVCSLV
jgi:hypothetical protein